MKWIKKNDVCDYPNPNLGQILVFGKCGKQHVAFYVNGDWCHTECCYEDGHHFIGEPINFEYWMPLPRQPERLNPETSKEDAIV